VTHRLKKNYTVRDEAFNRRMAIWRHNSFLGTVKRISLGMEAIIGSEMATDESKELARNIYALVADLSYSLKKRKDHHK
jgi:hypothetical protein